MVPFLSGHALELKVPGSNNTKVCNLYLPTICSSVVFDFFSLNHLLTIMINNLVLQKVPYVISGRNIEYRTFF